MILTGTGLPDDGVWRVGMLSKKNQVAIEQFPEYFSGGGEDSLR